MVTLWEAQKSPVIALATAAVWVAERVVAAVVVPLVVVLVHVAATDTAVSKPEGVEIRLLPANPTPVRVMPLRVSHGIRLIPLAMDFVLASKAGYASEKTEPAASPVLVVRKTSGFVWVKLPQNPAHPRPG